MSADWLKSKSEQGLPWKAIERCSLLGNAIGAKKEKVCLLLHAGVSVSRSGALLYQSEN
jgi:hypothetical protein